MQSQWGNYVFPFLSVFELFLLECSTLGTMYHWLWDLEKLDKTLPILTNN